MLTFIAYFSILEHALLIPMIIYHEMESRLEKNQAFSIMVINAIFMTKGMYKKSRKALKRFLMTCCVVSIFARRPPGRIHSPLALPDSE